MKRLFDIILAIAAIIALLLPIFFISIFIKIYSPGPIIFWSKRIGKNQKKFSMPKFRSMIETTPVVATHLLNNGEKYYTPIGKFLRKSSLDELPQLYCILTGTMSFVGPRPALYNQAELIHLREQKGVNQLRPGLTGLAQIRGRDELALREKVKYDYIYLKKKSFLLDLEILCKTCGKVFNKDGISH